MAAASITLSGVVKTRRSADRAFQLRVDDVALGAGEVVLLTGPNGTGKTTLLELMGLATRPDSGAIEVATERGGAVDVAALWARSQFGRLAALRAQALGYVLQSIQLLPFLSIFENAMLAQRLSGSVDRQRLAGLFSALGLEGREAALPDTLSPGLRQRAAVARALAGRPAFVLADEPTASLDPDGGDTVLSLLLGLAKNDGAGVLIVSHQADRIAASNTIDRQIATRPLENAGDGMLRGAVETQTKAVSPANGLGPR